MTTLSDVGEFVGKANEADRSRLAAETDFVRRQREMEAARQFNVGDVVVVEVPDPWHSVGRRLIRIARGRVVTIARGRVTLIAYAKDLGFLGRISVPAGTVRRSS